MCKCNPNVRTLFCEHCKFSDNTSPPEHVMEALKATVNMLEYSHRTSEQYYDHRKVQGFLDNITKYISEVHND